MLLAKEMSKVRKTLKLALAVAAAGALVGCSMGKPVNNATSLGSAGAPNGGGNGLSGPVVAGNGANLPGTGSMTVPAGPGAVQRIVNGMQGNVSPLAGNFLTAYNQIKPNLPKVTDPTKATGFDQLQLLIYAACSDLTTGNAPKMNSVYGVNPQGSIASNQSALVTTGSKILDAYTGGIASGVPAVSSDLTSLVNTIAGTASNTSTIAFMAVCMAANTAGSTMLGM
jgi:hypothetical protein